MIIGSKKLGDFLRRVDVVISFYFSGLGRKKGKKRGRKRLRKFKGMLGIGMGVLKNRVQELLSQQLNLAILTVPRRTA